MIIQFSSRNFILDHFVLLVMEYTTEWMIDNELKSVWRTALQAGKSMIEAFEDLLL